ncbi:stage II sporulation protein M [Pollutibacter soli]|uniref:stage II sporulation protein M n=1 Tax=Pollutibacter soli TaxID=3034157 RepID=UPI0030134969
MREALFLKLNRERWDQYDKVPTEDPDELAERFVRLTDDLAFARTFYPKSKTVKYLNGLASRIHLSIYKNKKEKQSRIITFWKYELPLLMGSYQKQLLYAFIFFVCFTLIGILSAYYDDNFIRLILGDGYVDMTNENIENGDPFGVYKQQDQTTMFIMIAVNNIFVSFRVFVMGLLWGVGTVYDLFRNGVMLGSFEYYFFSKGVGFESILVVFIHGTLEISAIVIAGAAGLVLGNSVLFPRTYTRIQSMMLGAKDGIKIMIGLVPVFIVAAFFEGFVTRYTGMPLGLSLFILIGSLTFIILYFVIYPIRLRRKVLGNHQLNSNHGHSAYPS